jgi:metallo-beta-lactamase family protein
MRQFDRPPLRTFVTHGDPIATDAMRLRTERELGWRCTVPDYLATFDLT